MYGMNSLYRNNKDPNKKKKKEEKQSSSQGFKELQEYQQMNSKTIT
jgi:hypothetical protein